MVDLSSFYPDDTRDSDGFIVLKKTYSELYKKTNYVAPLTLIQNHVYEYDIHAAGFSMLKRANKLSKRTISILESMSKEDRNKKIGLMIRDDKSLGKTIDKGLREVRQQFFQENGIQDFEVQAIRKDAIFIIGRKVKATKFGEHVEFVLKNSYSMYMCIDKIELYYDGKDQRVDIKGISDSIVSEPDHQNGMMIFFKEVFKRLSLDRQDSLRKYLIKFARDYKSFNLPHEYYRELSNENVYRTRYDIAGFEYNLTEASDHDFDIINPVYNYKRFVLPIIQMYI